MRRRGLPSLFCFWNKNQILAVFRSIQLLIVRAMCPSDKHLPNLLKSVQITLSEAVEIILRDDPALKPEAQQIAELVLRLQKIADRIESQQRQRSAP